jgi:hypothetical protein
MDCTCPTYVANVRNRVMVKIDHRADCPHDPDRLRQEPYSSLSHPAGPCLMGCGLCAAY